MNQIHTEAARIIKENFKLFKERRIIDEVTRRGNMCDRKVQTDPMPGLLLHDKLSGDKFKRFFFAVFYTYMMMNTIMAEALPKK